MISANIYIKIEKPMGNDLKRVEDAIELMKEIRSAISGCTSDESAYLPFLDMENMLESIKDGNYYY